MTAQAPVRRGHQLTDIVWQRLTALLQEDATRPLPERRTVRELADLSGASVSTVRNYQRNHRATSVLAALRAPGARSTVLRRCHAEACGKLTAGDPCHVCGAAWNNRRGAA